MEEKDDKEQYSDPTNHRSDDHQALGQNDGIDTDPPITGNREAQRRENRGKLTLRGSKSRIEQEGTAEGEGSGGGITGLLLGKTPVVPEFGRTLLQEGRVGEKGSVASEGIERMSGAEIIIRSGNLLRNPRMERGNPKQESN